MNELENQNVGQYVVHKSIPILLLKGGIAWFIMTIADLVLNRVPAVYQWVSGLNGQAVLRWANADNYQFFAALILNLIFGWIILYVVLSWFLEYYIIRSDAIIVRSGIIFSHEDVFQMEDVKSIDIYQGFWGKMFKTGTLKVYAFRVHKEIRLSDISDPYAVAAMIHEMHPTPAGLNWPPKTNIHNHRGPSNYVRN